MCYRTKLNSRLSKLEKSFDATFIEPDQYSPMEEINAFTFIKTPVVTDENKGEIAMFNWGLIPFWAKEDKIKKMTLNAKVDYYRKTCFPKFCKEPVSHPCRRLLRMAMAGPER